MNFDDDKIENSCVTGMKKLNTLKISLIILSLITISIISGLLCGCKVPDLAENVSNLLGIVKFRIIYNVEAGGYINGKVNQTVALGESSTSVTAVPNEGYNFVQWSDGNTESTRQETNVTNDIIVTAIFERLTYSVVYGTDGNGIISGQANQTVTYGESSTSVTAVPNEGYKFVQWSDGYIESTRQESNVKTDTTVTAIFEKVAATFTTLIVTYATDGNGTIIGEANQTVAYGGNSTSVMAAPNEGYRFIMWVDGITEQTRQETNVTSDLTLTAIFEKAAVKPTTVTVTYLTDGNGTIVGEANQTVICGEASAIVTAIPNEGYKFVKWSDGSTEPTRHEVNVNANKSLKAVFEKLKYSVKYIMGENGLISGIASQTVTYGESSYPITAIPRTGYEFVKWSDGNTEPTRQETDVKTNITLTALFEKITFAVTYATDGNGTIQGQANQTIAYSETSTIVTAIPNEGYKFVKWSDGSTRTTRQERNVKSNLTITAIFEEVLYTLIYTANEDYGYIEGETNQTVLSGGEGTTVTAVATKEDWEFYRWSDGVETPIRKDTALTSNRKITALFRQVVFTYEYLLQLTPNGRLEGETLQRVKRDETGTEVTVVPDEGYRFTGWSDGVKSPTRKDSVNSNIQVLAWIIQEIKVNYRVNKKLGGHIEGEADQVILYGKDSASVKAVADEGYVFVGWSDGVTEAERFDTNLRTDFAMTAYFEPKEKVFNYDYQGATSNTGEQSVTIQRNNPQASTFTIPQKTGFNFVGWYADEDFTVRVTDEDGKLMYGYNTVTLETNTLYARWSDHNDDTLIFKVLIIVVDEIDATLKLRADSTQYKRVQHKITMPERVLCKQIAPRMSAYLNEWFAGKVKFEIDTYFTMQMVDTEDFNYSNNSLDANRMKEVKHMYDKYDSLLTLFDLNDYDNEFRQRNVQGLASAKRGSVYLDECLMYAFRDKTNAEKLMQGDETVEYRWNIIKTCLHEFTHTVECRYGYFTLYQYDEAIIKLYYDGIQDYYEITRRYLLCEAEIEGEMVGIPPTFWTEGVWIEKV